MSNTTALSWNVRGLNMQARRDTVRTLVDDIRPSIVCLEETKLDVINQYLVFSLLGREFLEFAYLPASHTRGGILIAGRQTDEIISDVLVGYYSVTMAVQVTMNANAGNGRWWLTSVYGPQEDGDKALFL